MKIKTVLLFLVTMSLIFSCGCWDYREYEDISMVSALGFDTDNTTREVTVTLLYLVPGGSGASQANDGSTKASTGSAVVVATGPSIDDAFTKVQEVTGRKLFYGYMQEIIIGENAAERITKDIIGYINRTPNIRNSAYIAVTPGKAEDVLSTADLDSTEPASAHIHELIDESTNSGSAYPVTIERFLENLAKGGVEPVAPRVCVETKEQDDGGSSSAPSSSGRSSGTSSAGSAGNRDSDVSSHATVLQKQQYGFFCIDGVAAFRADKLIGWLDGDACPGLGFITNQKLYIYEVVKTSSEQNVMNTLIFRVTNSNCKIKIELKNGKPVVNINEYVGADLRKFSNNINAEFLTPDVISMLEKGLSDNVRAEISKAIEKGQKELKSDIFGIGCDFYRQYPKLWHSEYEQKWEQVFPTLQINVNVSAKVIDTGTTIGKFFQK